MSFHTIIIVGNLGKDPESRVTPNGNQVTNFNVASNRKYTGSNGQVVSETTWFRVSAWNKLAENCQKFLKKGKMVLVEGRLICDPKTGGPKVWQGQNGAGAAFEVDASTVRFLSPAEAQAHEDEPTEESLGSSIPF